MRESLMRMPLLSAFAWLLPLMIFGGEPSHPNVVFILVDNLGVIDIGAFNPSTFYETPNINALAAKGMKFTQSYAACPVCSPTRGSIMTGKDPPRFGVTDYIGGNRPGRLMPVKNSNHLPLEEVTVA